MRTVFAFADGKQALASHPPEPRTFPAGLPRLPRWGWGRSVSRRTWTPSLPLEDVLPKPRQQRVLPVAVRLRYTRWTDRMANVNVIVLDNAEVKKDASAAV